MKAIVHFGSHQFECSPAGNIVVNLLDKQVGEEFDIKEVSLVSDDTQESKFGTPYIQGASVRFEVLRHFRGEKVIVFKKRSKKAWKKKNGFRADLTELKVKEIKV